MGLICLSNLTQDERKDLYKSFDKTEFVKYVTVADKTKRIKSLSLKIFKKPLDRVEKSDFTAHFEHLATTDDEDEFLALLTKFYEGYIPEVTEIIKIANNTCIDNLSDEQKSKIEELRKTYDVKKFKTNFDTLVKISCPINEMTHVTKKNEKLAAICNELTDELAKKAREMENATKQHQQATDKLEKENSDLRNQIKELNTQIAELNEKPSFKSLTSNLSSLIGEEYIGKSYDEIYARLSEEETTSIKENNYDKTMLVLAAKCAMIKFKESE